MRTLTKAQWTRLSAYSYIFSQLTQQPDSYITALGFAFPAGFRGVNLHIPTNANEPILVFATFGFHTLEANDRYFTCSVITELNSDFLPTKVYLSYKCPSSFLVLSLARPPSRVTHRATKQTLSLTPAQLSEVGALLLGLPEDPAATLHWSYTEKILSLIQPYPHVQLTSF